MSARFHLHAIKDGATVALVTPGSPVTEPEIAGALAWLAREGLKGKVMPNAFAKWNYLAGTDADRAADIIAAFADPEVSAVWCTRGGYGCLRLLSMIDWKKIAMSGKPLIGFSDATALQAAIVRRGGVALHGPVATSFSRDRDPFVSESLHNALRGGDPFPISSPAGVRIFGGLARGTLVGGCLTLVTDLLGTKEAIDFKGKIVAIEDTGERPHRIDAMLTRLIQSGLEKAAGIVFGVMAGTDSSPDPEIGGAPWRTIVAERIAPLRVPAITDLPFGHVRNLLTLPLGADVELDAEAGRLRVVSPFVR